MVAAKAAPVATEAAGGTASAGAEATVPAAPVAVAVAAPGLARLEMARTAVAKEGGPHRMA